LAARCAAHGAGEASSLIDPSDQSPLHTRQPSGGRRVQRRNMGSSKGLVQPRTRAKQATNSCACSIEPGGWGLSRGRRSGNSDLTVPPILNPGLLCFLKSSSPWAWNPECTYVPKLRRLPPRVHQIPWAGPVQAPRCCLLLTSPRITPTGPSSLESSVSHHQLVL
jgi:hypothetical protein